jgi:hypothetical protein
MTLAVATIAASSPLQAEARSTRLITLRTGPSYASGYATPGVADSCGGHSGHSGWGRRRYQAGTQTVMVTQVGANCPPGPPRYGEAPSQKSPPRLLTSLGMRMRHETPHCITQCFPYGPAAYCSCCDHSLKPIPDHSLSHFVHAALIRCGLIDTYQYNQSYVPVCGPGPSH